MTMPSSFRLKTPSTQFQTSLESPKMPSSFKSRPKHAESEYQSDEETQKEIERAQAQSTSRILETVLGAPGDIVSLGAHIFGLEPPSFPPSSHKLREFSEKATGGYTAPKTEFEERGGEVIQDIASMALPGAKKYNLVRNIGIPIVANLAQEGIKYATKDEKKGVYTKIGSMVLLDMLAHRSGGARKYAGEILNAAEKSIPKGVSVSSANLEPSLIALRDVLEKGGSRPSTGAALTKIKEILGDINKGKISVDKLPAYRRSINEVIDELKGFEVKMPPGSKKKAIANLNNVKKEIIKTGQEYGDKFNPEFGKLWKEGNEAFAAVAQSEKMTQFIEKVVGNAGHSKPVQLLFKLGIPAGLATIGATTPLGLAGAAATGLGAKSLYEGYQVAHRVMKSKALREYYVGVIRGAASGNASQVKRNIAKLDEAFQ